ncbi:MAG: hypothetical protein IJ060_08185 [Oscillospiraceae bacterium]|nr:hypothetical protein [Oscillospiraceae bacterium]
MSITTRTQTLAGRLADIAAAIQKDTEKQLETLRNDDNLKAEVKRNKEAEIRLDAKTRYNELRRAYGKEIDNLISDFRKIGDRIVPTATTSSELAAMIQMLQLAPQVNALMLDSVVPKANDFLSQQIITQIANKNGISLNPADFPKVPDQLTKESINGRADSLRDTIRTFFDAHAEFVSEHDDMGTLAGSVGRDISWLLVQIQKSLNR